MSINVNVSGNPVSIKRGKLITTDLDCGDDEFKKRRRIRLEQVRQQSKDIAEQVRNKVRQEKTKRLTDIEKQGEKELKKWQARKLLSLQQQYQECLKDIGLGHAEAALEEESDEEYERQNDEYKEIAKVRGEKATKKLIEAKQQQVVEAKAPLNKKKATRDVENKRSKMVVSVNNKSKNKGKSPIKKKKHNKFTTDIDISRRLVETENTETEDPFMLEVSSASSLSSKDEGPISKTETVDKLLANHNPQIQTSNKETPVEADSKMAEKSFDYYLSTQISDHIRNRQAFKNFEPVSSSICDVNVPVSSTHCQCCSCTKQSKPCTKNNDEPKPPEVTDNLPNIPSKPTVVLKTATGSTVSSNLNKVQYCDYKNRYSREYIPSQPNIERISKDSLEVCSTRSETDYVERMQRRDQDAQIRGKKALEKEKIGRDYNNMLQQLPVLQKQERLATISRNKPSFHMSGERLKQHEKKHQNRMENAYEKLFPQPYVITIPPKDIPKTSSSLPFQTISIDENAPPILNVGSWDFDVPANPQPHVDARHVTSVLVQEKNANKLDPSKIAERRQGQLLEMWKTLREKREVLSSQISNLPEDSYVRSMLDEVGGLDQFLGMESNTLVDKATETGIEFTCPKGSCTKRNKVSSSSSIKNRAEPSGKDKRFSKYNCRCNEDSSSSPVDKPKARVKSKIAFKKRSPSPILLTTGTQTTPHAEQKITSKSDEHAKTTAEPAKPTTELLPPPTSVEPGILTKASEKRSDHVQQTDADETISMCKIVIKIDEEGKPLVCMGPSKLKNKHIIVKTGVKRTTPNGEEDSVSSTNTEVETEKIKPKTQRPKKTEKPTPEIIHKTKEKPQPADSMVNNSDSRNHTTWKEYLSQNSTNTSTSYYSPPDLAVAANLPDLGGASHHLAGILKDKPQQRNAQNVEKRQSNNVKDTNVCPLMCIKKLLTMSRQSIDDLQISTASEMSTPGSSIIHTKSNMPFSDFMKDRNISPGVFSPINIDSPNTNSSEVESPNVMEIYNKLAENCTRKIEYLSSLLERNRIEKISLISPSNSGSDKDSSTKYLLLPPEQTPTNVEQIKNVSSGSSTDQDEINRQLLQIDYSLVERLKNMTPAQINEQFPNINLSISETSAEDSADRALIRGFKELVENHSKPKQTLSVDPFPPLAVDFSNLPTFEVQPLSLSKPPNHSKPPPSKGLTAARRFNTKISSTPHQLSTIIESETILSSRTQMTQTPETSLTKQDREKRGEKLVGPAKAQQVPSDSKPSSSSDSLPDILTELTADKQSTLYKKSKKPGLSSDSSTSELDTFEAMLDNLGMGSWALATLRKTQESLAIQSSSSSTNIRFSNSSSSNSESLRRDSGTGRLDEESHGSSQFIKDLQDISALDKATRRTSTPIQNSVSDQSKSNVTGEMEGSVKTSSGRKSK